MVSFYNTISHTILTSLPQGVETTAYIIGALTASGGTLGYVRTGSVPSVVAGVTVGALVCVPMTA